MYGMNKVGWWSIRAYSDNGTFTLAKAWAHRLFYFVKLWQEAGFNEGQVFSEEDLAGYHEPVALQELARHAEGLLAVRIRQLRNLRPR